ncbi:hypothetical protein CP556_12360 [Natrinema sp. CBA1119]|uniref:RICIN domain-containing protein n=1 Tax=Natrinema sp. CBA1119 TaxID=1608465 RepID=UPI000BF69B7E|nr:RICIN domain-containing protein [Natrinema sp. CBA1119]PGF16832.1 hypothetical protein CP556_12360 [Natrinema sp. CBA1119]
MSHDNDRVGSTGESIETNRRTMLRLSGAAAASATGLAATSGAASAQWSSSGVDEFDLDGVGAADELPNSDESELVIYLHGGGVSDSAGDQGQSLQDGLADAGYDTTVIAGVFSTDAVGIGEESSEASENLADLIEDYDDSTGGTIRIVGYSLGGIVTMQTLNALEDGSAVETAASFGTGTPDSTVCEGGVYHDGIAASAAAFRAYVSENDSAVQSMNALYPDCAGSSPPANLTRIDVTNDVSDHLSYLDSTVVMDDLAASFAGGTSAQIAEGTYRLTNANSGKFLEVANANTSDGANVQQYADTGHPCQQWVVSDNGDGTYTFTNDNSGKLLEVANAETTDGANVQQWGDTGHPTQDWIVLDNGDGTYTLENANSGKVAEVYEGSTADGANVNQWSSNGGAWQRWTLEQV